MHLLTGATTQVWALRTKEPGLKFGLAKAMWFEKCGSRLDRSEVKVEEGGATINAAFRSSFVRNLAASKGVLGM